MCCHFQDISDEVIGRSNRRQTSNIINWTYQFEILDFGHERRGAELATFVFHSELGNFGDLSRATHMP